MILCVGDLMQDVLVQLPGPLAVGSDTPGTVTFAAGGSAANTASWLGWLGTPVSFAGRVGNDPAGRAAVAALTASGVRVRAAVDPALPTGSCVVLIGPDGERTMIPSAGANAGLRPDDLTGSLAGAGLTGTAHLHLSGYLLLRDGSRAAGRAVLAEAAAAGWPVSVDVASAAPIRTVGGRRLLGWLPAGCLLLANTDELAALTDDRPDRLAELTDAGHTLVVKDGSRGARLIDPAGSRTVPAEPVSVLDSTGAGDAFAAGLLAALQAGHDLVDAIRAGHRTGGIAVSRLGARPPAG